MSKEDFKSFVSGHPELSSYVKSGDMSWQKFYELFDLYGSDNKVWDDYLGDRAIPIKGLGGVIKNIKIDNVQKYVNNAKKAIDLFQELNVKNPTKSILSKKGPLSRRPINKIFED